MSLLDVLARRGGIPSLNEMQRQQAGGQMPPFRGQMPWNSGFEGMDRQTLEEILRAMQMREQDPQQNLMRMMPIIRMGGG